MFAALANQWIDTEGLHFDVHLADVEQLNEWAASGVHDITKMSFHRALALHDQYLLLPAGAALGHGCGPLLIAKELLSKEEILQGPVALPGEWTTAHLLFNIFYPGCTNKRFVVFSEIEDMILAGAVKSGVIIHENRFTYASKGLVKLNDLGEAWEMMTGLPIPLGGIFAASRLSPDVRHKVGALIRQSIEFARLHPEKVMPYVKYYSQEMDDNVVSSHIGLYVNEFSLNLGSQGIQAIETLKKILREG
jgi:1,4-dihydroxy-6-naphthoate synthase